MQSVPLIDMTPARSGGEEGKRLVAAQIDAACRSIGFFVICGHGIERSIFDDAHAALERFFALPLEEKEACRTDVIACGQQRNGYAALLEENGHAFMGRQGMPSDYVEKFSVGRWILDAERALPFPPGPQGAQLRAAMQRYYQACGQFTAMLTELFAIAIGLPRGFFADKTDQSCDFLRFLTYPAHGPQLSNRQGCADHTDSTLLTILTDTSPGLEVQTLGGDWVKVKTTERDHFVCNIGDLMMRWSNDWWRSTPHRVTLTEQRRNSIVYFKIVNDDTLIETFPAFCRTAPSKYAPITYADFNNCKMSALVQ